MQNEKELFNMMKKAYPQSPSKEFIVSTENNLKQRARKIDRNKQLKRFSAVSTGIILFAVIFLSVFLFNGQTGITNFASTVEKEFVPFAADKEDPSVFIYHTHNYESYLPEWNITQSGEPFSPTNNVTLVGKELSKSLKAHNINSIYNDTDIHEILQEQNLSFNDSYMISREIVQETLEKNKSIKMIFDIHRDSAKRSNTTLTIDGTDYAKIMFVVSKTSVNYEENKSFAIRIHKKLEQMYPGLSRGVIEKGVDPKNTYNQDIQNQSLLLDIGGVENTLEESYRSTEALAKAIAEIIRETNE